MTISAKSILQRVVVTLNDETSIRWTIPELIRYFNDGQRDIVTLRPDSMNKRIEHSLVAGYKQTLPSDATKLIDINANTTGTKGAVTLVASAILDAQMRNWRNSPQKVEILHFTYDARQPRTFEVYPPAAVGAALDLEYSAVPVDIPELDVGTTVADVTGNLSMSDLFANAMQNYILYRCYSKDTEYTANPQRAASFHQDYANDLGVEIKTTIGVGPTQKKQASPAESAATIG